MTIDEKAKFVYSEGTIDVVPKPDHEDGDKYAFWFRYTPKDSDKYGFFELTQGVNRPLDFIRNIYKFLNS